MKNPEKSITTRYPEDLYKAIKQRAENEKRSFNAEIVYELQQYRQQPRPSGHMGTIPTSAISAKDLDEPELTIEEAWSKYAL